ncbi:MAG: valine--tRNA ligase [Almyronema sp.]
MTASSPSLSSQYDPAQTEAKWQQRWEDQQIFKADPKHEGKPYCVVIPPPNVTGSLHMGHAFEMALIDLLVRYHRMRGRNTLWLPGTDHASIAVSAILDQELRSQGKTRQDIDRDTYLERAWQWKESSGGTIVNQLRKLGVSVDWSRERFTMDAGLSDAVMTAFNWLYEEGLIYRGNYMVNWCPASQSAVSDLEVENKEVDGHLWHFRYPLTDGSGYVEVATTRPETMLGDTAVAVNPNDDRYKDLVGKTVMLPIMEREIPIIADEYVDASFGTGCVKVTPAHDPNDFEMGQRHNLPMITIMSKDGSMNEQAGIFAGLDRFKAREAVVKRLDDDGFLVETEDYKHSVPYSDRGKVPVEPLLSTQWFVKIRPLAEKALDALDNHESPQFVPGRWRKVYRDWLVNLRDWCISRQLWWGHQIPAWYAVSQTEGEITDHTPYIVAMSAEAAREKAIAQFGEGVELRQDPDVLDTWFSSGLWPFSTMGWPDQAAEDLQTYYPTSTLVTGFDIIFFWVARMTMMAGHFTDTMPFETVYIHGLVRDENNQKMSKSKGNGIDPLLLINKYGTDALRYTLIREVAGAGQDIRLEYDRETDESVAVEAAGKFANKLWNASRFVMMNLAGQTPAALGKPDTENLELSDRWILSRFYRVVQQTCDYIDAYGMGEAAKELYEFIWGDFCDWYIELVKSRLQSEGLSKQVAQQTLAYVLDGILRLLHPFMPHITEEVWHTLNQVGDDQFLAVQAYPSVNTALIDADLERQFELLIGTVRTIRNLRAEAGVKPAVKVEAILQSDDPQERQILSATEVYIKDLAKVKALSVSSLEEATPPETPATRPQPLASAPADRAEPSPTPTNAEAAPETIEITSEDIATEVGEWGQSVLTWLENPQAYLGRFWRSVRRPAITVGLLLGLLVLLQVISAILRTLEDIPLLAALLQLTGLVYVLWFASQKLLSGQKRQQLGQQAQTFWQQIRGDVPAKLAPAPEPKALLTAADAPDPLLAEPAPKQAKMFAGVVGTVQVLIPLTGVADIEALRTKLEKDLSRVENEIKSLSGRLNNPGFVNKAPADVVQGARDALAEAETQAEILRDRLTRL